MRTYVPLKYFFFSCNFSLLLLLSNTGQLDTARYEEKRREERYEEKRYEEKRYEERYEEKRYEKRYEERYEEKRREEEG